MEYAEDRTQKEGLPMTKILFVKKNWPFAVLLALVMVLSSCDWNFWSKIRGSGIVIEETRTVALFNSMDMSISADVFFTWGAVQSLRIVGDDNILPHIDTDVRGDGMLEIKSKRSFRTDVGIKIYAVMLQVKGFILSGSGDIQGQNPFSTDGLDLKITGSGDMEMSVDAVQILTSIPGSGSINLRGSTPFHSIEISGSGDFLGLNLITDETEITISGSGDCHVFANSVLDVKISGSGNVYYMGSPYSVTTQVTGSGQVFKLD
jgi:hypothetical protein